EFGFVDVRDVAKAHILALENEKAEGRFIVTERTAGVYELAEIIKAKFPKKYKLPIMLTPKIMLYLTGWMFGLSIKFIRKNVGYSIKLDNCKSINILGQHYTPLENTVQDMINQMESAL
ncbi:MAG: diaminohydroxyphosphoribosylaminopyrimidine deaminase, partial [Bacteroidota bacterium]|nr:diaminohydroxyphosphoribosylaminopyrimidine deaminase [Bacteroidota bacterium]